MIELSWVEEARKHIGLREVKGARHSPSIVAWLEKMGSFSDEEKAWWREDESAWCGLFTGYCLGVSDRFVVSNWYRALAWQSPMLTKLSAPAYGCIVTFNRKGGGHVGFVVGVDKNGYLMVLGGNQSDQVSIVPFHPDRVSGLYWPSFYKDGKCVQSAPSPARYKLPLLLSNGKPSTNEA